MALNSAAKRKNGIDKLPAEKRRRERSHSPIRSQPSTTNSSTTSMASMETIDIPDNQSLRESFVQAAPGTTFPDLSQNDNFHSFPVSIKGLSENLPNVRTKEEVNAWLADPDLFAEHWQEYYDSYLKPILDSGQKIQTPETLVEVNTAIQLGESGGRRTYSRGPHVNKRNWSHINHLARFVYAVTKVNMEDRNGAFFNSGWSEERCRHAIWHARQNSLNTLTRKTKRANNSAQNRSESQNDTEAPTLPIEGAGPDSGPVGPSSLANIGSGTHSHGLGNAGCVQHSTPRRTRPSSDGEKGSQATMLNDDRGLMESSGSGELLLEVEQPILDPPHQPRTDWQLIIDERNAAGCAERFDVNVRYWQLAAIYGFVNPSDLPPSVTRLLGSAARDEAERTPDEIIRELNAASETWKAELDARLRNGAIVISGLADEEDQERFAQEEKTLNTTPHITYDEAEVTRDLHLIGGQAPRLESMPRAQSFSMLQVVGIWKLVKMAATLNGALLADAMGLGKTAQIIGFTLYFIEERARAIAAENQVGPARPNLIVVPAGLVDQMYDEFEAWTQDLDIMLYYGDHRGKGLINGRRVVDGLLTQQHPLFHHTHPDETDISRRIVITSIQTWNQRHGPAKLKEWRRSQRMARADIQRLELVADPTCPHIMPGQFEIVAVDECHLLKAEDGHWAAAIEWLSPTKFTLLVSATPGINRISDWKGYLTFMQPRQPPLDENGLPYPEDCNPFIQRSLLRDAASLQMRPDIFQNLIVENSDATVAGMYIRTMQEQCVVRRTFATRINGEKVGATLPNIYKYHIDCMYTQTQLQEYQQIADPHLKRLILKLKKLNGKKDSNRFIWNQKLARKLILDSEWLGYEYCNELLLGEDIESFTKRPDWFHQLLDAVRQGRQALDGQLHEIPSKTARLSQVQKVCKEAPKYRALLGILGDLVVRQNERAIVWATYPAQQKVVEYVIASTGIRVGALMSYMTPDQRSKLIYNFCNRDDSPDVPQVMVLAYSMSSAGLNLQKRCRITIHLSMPMSRAMRDQADARTRRIGQARDVYSYVLHTPNTFNDRQYENNLRKAVPGIVSELNKSMYQVKLRETELGEVTTSLEAWYLVNGVLTPGANVTAAQRVQDDVVEATVSHIVDHLQNIAAGKKLTFAG